MCWCHHTIQCVALHWRGSTWPWWSIECLRSLLALTIPPCPITLTASDPIQINPDALAHFDKLMALCVCTPTCNRDNLLAVAAKFRQFNESELVGFVRNMHFATSCNVDMRNQCLATSSTESRKRKRRANMESVGRTTIGYYIRGQHFCRPTYAAVVQLSEKCVERHAKVVAAKSSPYFYLS